MYSYSSKSILTYMGGSFTSHYMTLKNIQQLIRESPDKVDTSIILTLEKILKQKDHDTQKLASILYREAANLLRDISIKTKDSYKKRLSLNILKRYSLNIINRSSLAASFALGTLPLNIKGPDINSIEISDGILKIDQDLLFDKLKVKPIYKTKMGRSFVWKLKDRKELLVFKFSKDQRDLKNLLLEIKWIKLLKNYGWNQVFEIPREASLNGKYLFWLNSFKFPCICFFVSPDYFYYPNGDGSKNNVPEQEFLSIISKCANILGKLTTNGIIHTSVIPLFHNRTQRTRRDDRGIYLWERGGRLDRWLDSALYPNIGKSGIRDFEHLISYDGVNKRRLYTEIGNHMLSFFLIIGSYFRMKCPEKKGINPDGSYVDVRNLFDKELFKKSIELVVKNYFSGFCGYDLKELNFTKMDQFVDRLIDEMGVDRYLDEIFRTVDQLEMDDNEFKRFLKSKGVTDDELAKIKKGERDIVLKTGPHLGEFNGRISVPELIDFIASTAALMISSKYINKIQG